MSRIYQSDNAPAIYRGAAQSEAFNPVAAVSNERAIREWTEARKQDAETIGNAIAQQNALNSAALGYNQQIGSTQLTNAQRVESGNLGLQQLVDRNNQGLQHMEASNNLQLQGAAMQAGFAVENATTSAFSTAISGLLSLSSTYADYQAKQQFEAKKVEAQNQILDSIGLSVDSLFSNAPPAPEVVDQSKYNTSVQRAESQAITEVAAPLAASNNPADVNTATKLEQSTSFNQLGVVRGNVYSARAMFPVAFEEAVAAGKIRPGAQGYADAVEFTRQYALATGLAGADRALLAEVFAPTVQATIQNSVIAITTQQRKEVQAANLEIAKSRVSDLADGSSTVDVGASFDKARDEVVMGNAGFSGKADPASTQFTLKEFLANLKEGGKVEEIKALRAHVYNPATQRTLGQDFDHIFDEVEKQATQQRIDDYNEAERSRDIERKQSVQFFMDNPTPENRNKAIEILRQGDYESQQMAAKLAEHGLTYDPSKKFELMEMEARGIQLGQPFLDQLYESRIINAEEHQYFSKRSIDSKAAAKLKPSMEAVRSGLKQALMGTASKSNTRPEDLASLGIRHELLMSQLEEAMITEVKANPALISDPERLAQVIENKSKWLLQQPQFKMDRDPDTKLYRFGAPMKVGKGLERITVAPGVQDFTQLAPDKIFGSGFPRTEMQAGRDGFLSKTQLNADVKAVLSGKDPSNRTRLIAKNLGISSQALVEAQLSVHGLPSLSVLRQGDAALSAIDALPLKSSRAGMQHLRSMGFPRRGAAMIAANIQSESSWNGMRVWGQVAGDGSDRNGGLISWMDDADIGHFRLRRIEQHLGKSITKASHAEQLAAMKWEMQKYYKESYDTFMNPNSSQRELEHAAYRYWGWRDVGARFTYYKNLIASGSP